MQRFVALFAYPPFLTYIPKAVSSFEDLKPRPCMLHVQPILLYFIQLP